MNSLRRSLLPAATMLGLLVLFQLAVRAGLTPPTLVAPTDIARGVAGTAGLLWFHLEPTLLVAVTGFLVALGLALAIAALVYVVKPLEATVMTIGTVIDSIPMIAIAPVLVIWMGLTLPMRITITTIICLFPIFISVLQGLKSPPATAEELFANLAATPLQRFRLLAIPYALPYLFVGLKIAAPLAILGALIAEWTGAERGLGVYMLNAMFGLRVVELWSGVVVACAVSAGAYLLVSLFELLSVADAGQREVGT
jgi:ABC-type nitrate/sulfonate/bicarbonate transport system permease component